VIGTINKQGQKHKHPRQTGDKPTIDVIRSA